MHCVLRGEHRGDVTGAVNRGSENKRTRRERRRRGTAVTQSRRYSSAAAVKIRKSSGLKQPERSPPVTDFKRRQVRIAAAVCVNTRPEISIKSAR
ncbi:hypothetical protein SKAU_G00317730 [Synaphobranchus kaupii]|uniref:Uncharacterized protein n=1 Tax=Synaphobranchus kaupii TaxID=118154 RepID=A0A9Q1ET63_SYNKA|nr:hypothetical protein SKAU_G00317730 [Synaphobranchus kaupii]